MVTSKMSYLLELLEKIQEVTNFKGCERYPQFSTPVGLGRVGVGGFFLGVVLGIHLSVLVISFALPVPWIVVQWSIYVAALSSFHFSEFLVTALFKPETVSYDSFIINHSLSYTAAAIASWIEYWLESLLPFPVKKFQLSVFSLGCLLVIMGQAFRAAAMWTAKSNFSHLIMEKRESSHQLVQHGVYRYLRHPSYFGWFWWCVGTQLVLCNPICSCAYAFAAWDFFSRRIPHEEATLCRFYPNEYPAYMQRTIIGIPFLSRARTHSD
jgi:protein-S-isoprenylcysteine O-methyltransferase